MVPHLREIKCSGAVLRNDEGTVGGWEGQLVGWFRRTEGAGGCAPLQTHVNQFVLIGDDEVACGSFATNY